MSMPYHQHCQSGMQPQMMQSGLQQPMMQPQMMQPGMQQQMMQQQQMMYQQCLPQNPLARLTPELQMRFRAIDTNNSNSILANEIAAAYKQMNFPEKSAHILILAITDKGYIDIDAFPMFDFYVCQFFQKFQQFMTPTLSAQNVEMALMQLNFRIQPNETQLLIKKYGRNNMVDFGQFLAICSYLLLCGKVMTRFDMQRQGRLTVDFAGLINMGLWFE